VDFYNRCSSARKTVNWYSASRVQAMTAYDWIHDQLTPAERKRVGEGFFRHYRDCLAGRRFERQNRSDYKSGFYGPTNMAWYIGLAFYGDGVDDGRAAELLRRGYDQHIRLLEFRRRSAGDDGGMGTLAAGYAFGMYPWAEFNFMHTYNSATGLQIERSYDHMSLLPNWVVWNCLPGRMRFGMGDSSPAGRFSDGFLEMHMLQIAHFYAERHPDRARLAMWVRNELLRDRTHDAYWWPLAPLLVTRCGQLPPPAGPDASWPLDRNFEAMGIIFMKGGRAGDDVQAMFCAGGKVHQHGHYDEGHFAIFRKEHLTGNSGHYGGRARNEHLAEYFYRSVAANCVLIHAPAAADRPAVVWGGAAATLDGGQYKHGGRQIAFETNNRYGYAATDMTDCYFPAKCKQAIRQFVLVRPDTFVVFDRVIAANAAFRKVWLMHSVDRPTIGRDGRSFRIEAGPSVLQATVLAPDDARVVTVGGPGKEFLSAGRNRPQTGRPRKAAGAWRVEVSPSRPREIDRFLHVIRVGDKSHPPVGRVERIRLPGRIGARITAGDGASATVLFNASGPVGGNVSITGPDSLTRPLTTAVQPQAGTARRRGKSEAQSTKSETNSKLK